MSDLARIDELAAPTSPKIVGRRGNNTLLRLFGSVAGVVVIGHLVLALVVPWLPIQSPTLQTGDVLGEMSSAHWLGTDNLGRDTFARMLWGGRPSIGIALMAAIGAAIVGLIVGMLAALIGGWLDDLVMRLNDILLALPSLLVLMLVASFIGRETMPLVLTLVLMYFPPISRMVRSATLNVLTRDFVVAARLRGASTRKLVTTEVLPNIAPNLLTEVAMQFTWILLAFSALSFLGLGVQAPTAEWGLMISDARAYLTTSAMPMIAPIVMLASLVLAVNGLVDRASRGSGR